MNQYKVIKDGNIEYRLYNESNFQAQKKLS